MRKIILLFSILCIQTARADHIMNAASSNKDLLLTVCSKAFLDEACKVEIETLGFGNATYTLYDRLESGELIPLKSGSLNSAGKALIALRFQEIRTSNLIVVVFSKGSPVAMSGWIVDVYPSKKQLGEQISFPLSIEILGSKQRSYDVIDDEYYYGSEDPEDPEYSNHGP